MSRLFPALVLLSLAWPAAAEDRMNAAEFEAYTTGQTLTFSFMGVPYGMEQYLPGRRVIWAFIGEDCQEGRWYEEAGNICFVYDHAPVAPQCWTFRQAEDGLHATFAGEGSSTELYEVERSSRPLVCEGPQVGV
jgi:hypothetical protein